MFGTTQRRSVNTTERSARYLKAAPARTRAARLDCAGTRVIWNPSREIPRTDPLVQVNYVRVVNLDIGARKLDICAIRVVTIMERAGRTRGL
jgi:hypothetical protein